MLQGPGENAGVLDLGDGLAVAFKVESHNHPSAVEPFQGAATGVGGILRDIIAMGARPIALLDGCASARPDAALLARRRRHRHYGNCVGVPNVGGEVVFDDAYAANCLVNAMCVGLLSADTRHERQGRHGRRACRPLRRHAPAATASAAPACSRARSWARRRQTSARPCRSATRSPASG